MAHTEQAYTRFTIFQRIEHIVLIASFSTLGLTGLVQKYAGSAIAEWLIGVLGGIETVRTIHHVAAAVFTVQTVYHAFVLAYKVFVHHDELSMLPGIRDLLDAIAVIRYNLGLAKDRPALPRYGFEEKVEYWAMIWGTVVMALTGFMLWNPITITRFLPGQAIPAAKAAHGGEAVLAVLAIIVWHFYNVHLKTFNKSMFTGKLTREQMAHEHGEELERLVAGKVRPAPAPEVLRRRERLFIPFAVVITIVMVGALIF